MPQRSIKFRGWNYTTGKMINLQAITPLALSGDIPGLFLPNDSKIQLLQFTGQRDDQGREIYEGDIVCDHMDEDSTAHVYYDESEAAFLVSGEGNWEYLDGETLTVIGNQYENPELLNL